MSETSSSLNEWFSGRPQWLQHAAALLSQKCELGDEDISELANLCKREADGESLKTTCRFPALDSFQGAAGVLHLRSIHDVKGINALAPNKPLEFGDGNLTIVYGDNGSGKSGYVRLLKHVCGARETGALHPNVYESGVAEQKAGISFKRNGNQDDHTWSSQEGICDALGNVGIFDISFDKIFVGEGDEVSYEPPALSVFSSLIGVCGKVKAVLESEAGRLPSKKPDIPDGMKATSEGHWYESISAETGDRDIDKHCAFGDADKTEMQRLQKRLDEQAPKEKADQLKTRKKHIDDLVQRAQKHLKQLSDENCRQIVDAGNELNSKKEAAETAAKKAFSDSLLEGIGSDVWKELWKAARNYSESFAYKESEYPNVSDGSRCVLCHQLLEEDAKKRLISFEDFVKGEMQKAAKDADEKYETALQTIEELPSSEMLSAPIHAAGITRDEDINQVTDFFDRLQARRNSLFESDKSDGAGSEKALSTPLPSTGWIEKLKAESKTLDKHAEEYTKDAERDNREDIQKKLKSLETRKWLSERRTDIDEEITRLKRMKLIEKAKKSADTTALSKKKGELAETLITNAFVRRFNEELKELEASEVRVELIKSGVSRGRVLHKLQLRGARRHAEQLTDVLSEGEKRIISIAAFLADITGKNAQDPLIFDDPISSLDQNYEEAVVKRLITLSQDRQIIVFTHRLPLLAAFRNLVANERVKLNAVSIRSEEWRKGEPGPIPLSQREVKSALNELIDKVKKHCDNKNSDDEEIFMKSICGEFRILVERSIEEDLLCGVVQRFNRQVRTSNVMKLAKLKPEDCSLLDCLMTKYSKNLHSQPAESPAKPPKAEDVLKDINKLIEWRKEYEKRNAQASA